jgi:hypothetical protein
MVVRQRLGFMRTDHIRRIAVHCCGVYGWKDHTRTIIRDGAVIRYVPVHVLSWAYAGVRVVRTGLVPTRRSHAGGGDAGAGLRQSD